MTKAERTLIQRIITAKTQEELNVVCAEIDSLFSREKIRWEDHEVLYELTALVRLPDDHE